MKTKLGENYIHLFINSCSIYLIQGKGKASSRQNLNKWIETLQLAPHNFIIYLVSIVKLDLKMYLYYVFVVVDKIDFELKNLNMNWFQLLKGLDVYLQELTVLPPSAWNPDIRLDPPKSLIPIQSRYILGLSRYKISVYLDIWIFGYLDIWIFGYLDIWIFGYLDIWIFGYLDIWIFGYLYICISGYLENGIIGYLENWIIGYLENWIIG